MSQEPDIRWCQRFDSFCRAHSQLEAALQLSEQRPLSTLEQQGLIQAFEFTHELAWKTLKDFLESRGNSKIYGSKDATREAFTAELIENGDDWMTMIAARNRSSHTYNEKTANELSQAISSTFAQQFQHFRQTFKTLVDSV